MADTPTQTQQPSRVVYVVIHLGGGGISKPGPAPASKASIEAMPRIKVTESGNNCSVCLEEFEVDEEVREMPCKHVFHSGCIEKWLQIHGSCPVCRFLMPAETAETGGGNAGQGSLGGGEINGLGFVQSVLTFASYASLMAMMGSGQGQGSRQPGSDRVDDGGSSAQDMDCNGNE